MLRTKTLINPITLRKATAVTTIGFSRNLPFVQRHVSIKLCLGKCHYLAGGGEGHYFGGEGHDFFSLALVWGRVTIFFQGFLGEGHNFFKYFY